MLSRIEFVQHNISCTINKPDLVFYLNPCRVWITMVLTPDYVISYQLCLDRYIKYIE